MQGGRFGGMAGVGLVALMLAGCAGNRALVTREPLSDDKVGFGFFSHTTGDGAQRNHKHFDNFDLVRNAQVTGVQFWGLSDGTDSPDLENFDSFTVEIYDAGDDRSPGDAIYSFSVDIDDATPQATGRRGIGTDGAGTGAEYAFTVMFDEPVSLTKETEYFLVVTASRIDPDSDNFMWSDGQRDDGISYSWSYDREQMLRIDDTDSALVILGRPK